MSYHEAWLLARTLASDATSRTAVALNEWDYAFSREAAILADLFDLTVAANTDRKRRGQTRSYPRPWRSGRRSQPVTADQSTVRAALAARGH